MNLRGGLARSALLTLLTLPACLSPIVGTQCAAGYSPCNGSCVATGSCTAADAADSEASEEAPDVDARAVDAGEAPDAASLDITVGVDISMDSEMRGDDTAQANLAKADAQATNDAPVQNDDEAVPIVVVDLAEAGADDVPLQSDAEYAALLPDDAAAGDDSAGSDASDGGSACCLDAEDATPGGATDSAEADAQANAGPIELERSAIGRRRPARVLWPASHL